MELKPIILPFTPNALEPIMSENTVNFHFGKHYNGYVTNCNNLKKDTEFENKPLNEIITGSDGALFNNAAQVKNHEMFFLGLSQNPTTTVSGKFLEQINKNFGSFENLKQELSNKSATFFGSGWIWLVENTEKELEIVQGSNAYCPLTLNMKPLMCIDVWEHAYYLDYQNRRPDFINELWKITDWKIIQQRFESA